MSAIRRTLILVVDDEADVRELIADVLVGRGYEVEMALTLVPLRILSM